MNHDEAKRVNINTCVRDDELLEMEATTSAAEPGEWRVRDGKVTRFSGAPVASTQSFTFMAKARAYVPRLLTGVRALEEALRTAWATIHGMKLQAERDRKATEAALARNAKGSTGPEGEVAVLLEARRFGMYTDFGLERQLRRWALGESVVEPWFHDMIIKTRIAAEMPFKPAASNVSCLD
jgi:hypothetical protein